MTHSKVKDYANLIRFDKPIGWLLLLWPTLWALWTAAGGIPDLKILLVFVLGVFVMRSAGCAINDFADRDIDAHVERTESRPLATGAISAKEAIGVFVVLALLAFILALQLNALTFKLSVVALILAASYPFMKRVHMLPQVHLGIAFAWAIPMAYTALNVMTKIANVVAADTLLSRATEENIVAVPALVGADYHALVEKIPFELTQEQSDKMLVHYDDSQKNKKSMTYYMMLSFASLSHPFFGVGITGSIFINFG